MARDTALVIYDKIQAQKHTMKIKILLLAAIIAGGLAVRALPVRWGLPSDTRTLASFFPDEQDSFRSLSEMDPAHFDFNPGFLLVWGGAHINFLGAAMKAAELAGAITIGSREYFLANLGELDKLYILARLIPVIAGTISIWLIYLVLRGYLGGAPVALAGAFLFALAPLHVFYSHYVRPDVPMIMCGLLVALFSLRLLERGSRRDYIICGALAGLTISAKYNGGAFLVFPVFAHLIRTASAGQLSPRRIFTADTAYAAAALFAAFALTAPYSLTPTGIYWIKILMAQAEAQHYWQSRYLAFPFFLLPTAVGWPFLLAAAAGYAMMAADWFRGRDPRKLLLLLSSLAIYCMNTMIGPPTVLYAMPMMPVLSVFAAYFLVEAWRLRLPAARLAGRAAAAAVILYSLAYSMAMLDLFMARNVRLEASDWIESNIPKGAAVAIGKSHFWTPPVLRQPNPPYKLMAGGKDGFAAAIFNLGKLLPRADYLVLSEYEYRDYLHPKLAGRWPAQAAMMREIFEGKEFEKVAEFSREPRFLGLGFGQAYKPGDWMYPNPRIVVFKKRSAAQAGRTPR